MDLGKWRKQRSSCLAANFKNSRQIMGSSVLAKDLSYFSLFSFGRMFILGNFNFLFLPHKLDTIILHPSIWNNSWLFYILNFLVVCSILVFPQASGCSILVLPQVSGCNSFLGGCSSARSTMLLNFNSSTQNSCGKSLLEIVSSNIH